MDAPQDLHCAVHGVHVKPEPALLRTQKLGRGAKGEWPWRGAQEESQGFGAESESSNRPLSSNVAS